MACPHYTETDSCNLMPCSCTTSHGIKNHGSKYVGFGKNYCNQCRCHAGVEVCTKRACAVATSARLCESTTCAYGARFRGIGDDDVLTALEAVKEFGANWKAMPHEMTTLVRHHHEDANGAKFNCGHVPGTGQCKCYCSKTGNHHIWHRSLRHPESIAKGYTSAGCTCESNWSYDGKTYNGCQNPSTTPNPLVDLTKHGDKHTSWCKIVPGSCHSKGTHITAVQAGSNWDTCEKEAHLHMEISAPVRL